MLKTEICRDAESDCVTDRAVEFENDRFSFRGGQHGRNLCNRFADLAVVE
jgi:hypothetical protein